MGKANVYCRNIFAGVLESGQNGYRFQYAIEYIRSPKFPAISLTLPKQEAAFESVVLFPYFFGLLAEGENKLLQCRNLRIDENDHFTRLLKTCTVEAIGCVTVEEVS
jgi:HipA-like protein